MNPVPLGMTEDPIRIEWGKLLTFPLICLVCAFICLIWIDAPVGRYFVYHSPHKEVTNFFHAAEEFGTPYGQGMALLCIAAASGWKDRRVVRIFVGTCAGGMAANGVKMLFARQRPLTVDFVNQSMVDTFAGFLPLTSLGSRFQSFPSSHTASAFAFAALLSWAYPRGRGMFLLAAAFVGIHRIIVSAHFPSDVLTGAAIGYLVGWAFTLPTWLPRQFERFEQGSATQQPGYSGEQTLPVQDNSGG